MQFHPLSAEEARIIAYTVFIRRIRETGVIDVPFSPESHLDYVPQKLWVSQLYLHCDGAINRV